MSETWTRWEPLTGLPDKVYLERLVDDKGGILLEFRSEDGTVSISAKFDGSVFAYRNSDEGRRLKTIQFLDVTYGEEFYSQWSFFKVENSAYVEWLNQETYDIYSEQHIEHYVFLTANDVVDVLSSYSPSVSVL